MKKISLLVLLVLVTLGIVGCQGEEAAEKITIYDLQNSPGMLQIEDEETISDIEEAINTAMKMPGIVDMADPEYRIELGEQTYFLWLDEVSGTIMNTVDTHTIYTLKDRHVPQLYEIIQDWNKQ